MNILNQINIAKRLYLLCTLVALGLGILTYAFYADLSEVSRLSNTTGDSRVPQLQLAAAMERNVTRVSLQLRHAMLGRDKAEINAALNDITAKRQIIEKSNADNGAAVFTETGNGMHAKLQPLLKEFWRVGEANIELIKAGNSVDAFAFLVDKTIPARNQVLAELDNLVKFR